MKLKYGKLLLMILATTLFIYIWFTEKLKYFHTTAFLRQTYHEQLLYNQKDKFIPLPQSVINGVKYFVFFVGHSHSGHSIVGSILDSHPHMVVAHESKLFVQLMDDPERYNGKAAVFNELWNNSYSHNDHGVRSSIAHTPKNKGYSLQISGLYQGTYLSYIDVIGDKHAGKATSLFHHNSSEWNKAFLKLNSMLNIPFKVIYVIRNPFDNIASAQLYSTFNMRIVRNSNKTFNYKYTSFVNKIDQHFTAHQAIMDAKKQYSLDLLEVHHKDFVEHPNATIAKLCNFLGIYCSDSYIQICEEKLFKTESKMRYKVEWTQDLISKVQSYILKYENMARYYNTFDT